MLRRFVHAILLLTLAASVGAGEFVVPLMPSPPVLDGKIGEDEWRVSTGLDGFQFGGKLQRRRARGLVGATETHLHVAILSQLPDQGELLTKVDRDSLKVVHDDSLEVYVCPTPGADKRVDYQFLVNSLGKGGYNIHQVGGDDQAVAWKGGWSQAHGFHDGWWHFECTIPLASVAKGRGATDGEWGINLTRNWKNPWEWSSFSGRYAHGGCRFRFVKAGAPCASFTWSRDPFLTDCTGSLQLTNPGAAPLPLKASLVLERNRMPAIRNEEALSLGPGQSKALELVIPQDDATTTFGLAISVTSADGAVACYSRSTSWPRGQPFRWEAGKEKEVLPVDFRFAYYPYRNRMRIVADVSGLGADARLEKLEAVIRDRDDGEVVKTLPFPADGFREGRQELSAELPPLDGLYEIALRAEGAGVPEGEVVKRFERKVFPWERTPTGRSTAVYPPFAPIELEGRQLRTVLRRHELNDQGLLDQIQATSSHTAVRKPVLAAPMRWRVVAGGEEVQASTAPLEVVAQAPHEVRTEASVSAGPLSLSVESLWEYDGTVRVDVDLRPAADAAAVDSLDLVIPFRADAATLIHANSDRIRAPVARRLSEEQGVVWDASEVACDDYLPGFCPYVFLGTPVRGLCWFAENDLGWSRDGQAPNVDVVRSGDQVLLRVHLISKPTAITEPRTLRFGMLAAPVKPRLSPGGPNAWRYRYLRDRYTLLGTDVNWLSIGTCGSFYPAGKDLYLWEMLARGNREQLDGATIKAVEDWGERYYAPFGEKRVDSWRRHVRHNLRSRHGMNMVFYYNRASHQGCEEFETFKDEWCLTDLRAIGKGKGLGEIKVVPSDSYIDFNLYWYARSFEVGANRGVYWDNWFIAPSFNTGMTAAYRQADGAVVPAAGIWALRDLAKRTFVMLNERGMRPITFPHMTSFNPLPMMSFATVQYDWEWKYSLGDVQDRHSRELILLMTTGELAGVWPVPLGDHGKLASDPWTQKTYTAVRLVHELDGYGGFGHGWVKAHQANRKLAEPILTLLDEPDLQVYRYWDERPQPVVADHPDLPTIAYCVPGKQAVVAVTSYANETLKAELRVDWAALGLAPRDCTITDVEGGEPLAATGDRLTFELKKHDVKVLKLAGRE